MKYFKNITDLSELRKQYKGLLKKHHPDNGGNVADTQDINAEYDSLFKALKDRHDTLKSLGRKATRQYLLMTSATITALQRYIRTKGNFWKRDKI